VALARRWLLARTTALRTLDALHLASAAAEGATLVTFDVALAEAAEALGVPSLTPAPTPP
jgi:predicted nucleic acid-binding protein